MFVACPRQRGRGACRLLLSCAVTLLHPAIASAVEPRDVAAPAVVVTATRTEQRIIDAPGAISVVQKAEIDRVVQQYAAAYEIVPTPDSAAKYTVSHTTTVYALDTNGRVRLTFPYEATVDEIVDGIKAILAQRT